MEEEMRCPKCKSSQTRYRTKTNDRKCYTCGNTFNQIPIYQEEKERIYK